MSKSKARKFRAAGKSNENGALRFLKIRHGDKKWLLAHTAIVAGTMGVAMIGAPSIALADPSCTDNGMFEGYQQFNCNGVSPVPYDAVPTITVTPTGEFEMFFDGGEDSTPFIAQVSNGAVVELNAGSNAGYVYIDEGAVFDNEDGHGFVIEARTALTSPTRASLLAETPRTAALVSGWSAAI